MMLQCYEMSPPRRLRRFKHNNNYCCCCSRRMIVVLLLSLLCFMERPRFASSSLPPLPPGPLAHIERVEECKASRQSEGLCALVSEGDTDALMAALADTRVEEVWLFGAVALPPRPGGQTPIEIGRDVFVGGATRDAELIFSSDMGEPVLIVDAVLVFAHLKVQRLLTFLDFQQPEDIIWGTSMMPAIQRLESRHAGLPPFQYEWPEGASSRCETGILLYSVHVLYGWGQVFPFILTDEQLDTADWNSILQNIFQYSSYDKANDEVLQTPNQVPLAPNCSIPSTPNASTTQTTRQACQTWRAGRGLR